MTNFEQLIEEKRPSNFVLWSFLWDLLADTSGKDVDFLRELASVPNGSVVNETEPVRRRLMAMARGHAEKFEQHLTQLENMWQHVPCGSVQ
jgi:hypothetical protein